MISQHHFYKKFSLDTVRSLRTWANNNLIVEDHGDYAMSINYAVNGGAVLMYAETELTELTIDDSYTVRMYINNITSNAFRIFINALPNDNSSTILQEGWISTPAYKEFSFVATATTMYLAIGDENPVAGLTTSTVDNVTVKDSLGVNYITNGTFEGNVTTPWYGQSVNTVLSVFEYSPVVVPPPSGDYLVPINIPAYVDTGDDTDGLITVANGRYNETYLNRDDITNFYVEPGNYKSQGIVEINKKGTALNPRTISLHNGNDNHPGTMTEAENAQIKMWFRDSEYWVIDRMSVFRYSSANTFNATRSPHITVNRFYANLVGHPIYIRHGSHNFTLQKSRFDGHLSIANGGQDYDDIAANIINDWDDTEGMIIEPDGTKHYSCLDCKIISNEFVDQNDGFQISNNPTIDRNVLPYVVDAYGFLNAGGLILHDNDFYNTDPLNIENATDTKGGSPDPDLNGYLAANGHDNPTIDLIISGNRCWGYNECRGGTYGGSNAIIASMYSPGYKIYDNIMFDCCVGASGGSNSWAAVLGTGYVNTEHTNNIFYQCGSQSTDDRYKAPISMSNDRNHKMIGNYFIEPRNDRIARFADLADGSVFQDNMIIDPLTPNWYLWLREEYPSDTEFVTSCESTYEKSRAGFTDYVFIKDKYTNDPTEVTLPQILDPNGTIVSPE